MPFLHLDALVPSLAIAIVQPRLAQQRVGGFGHGLERQVDLDQGQVDLALVVQLLHLAQRAGVVATGAQQRERAQTGGEAPSAHA